MKDTSQVYVETTILSYLAAKLSRKLIVAAHQQITRQWWKMRRGRFRLYISRLVVEEAQKGDTEAAAVEADARVDRAGRHKEGRRTRREPVAKASISTRCDRRCRSCGAVGGAWDGLSADMELHAYQ